VRVPVSWLAEFVDGLPEIEPLAEHLTMAGLEVEAIEQPHPRLVEGLVVARIVTRDKHPNADRLSLCSVDDGDGEKQIVCGASNMKAGDFVVLASPGTVLPGGLKIKKSKIRGEVSLGMLCAASELEMAGDEAGILILGDDVKPGDSAAALLGLDEAVIEIGITPNRGDCLSIRGVAREVAAVCSAELKPNFNREFDTPGGNCAVAVKIDDEDLCPTYTGIEIRDVTIGPSPAWLVSRLSALGLNSVNNVVDVTNLVLFEYGQPLHAFDRDLLVGDEVGVRAVCEPVEFESLDEEKRALLPGDLAIWDGKGPVALAGVMGGMRTAVTDSTRNIFLESAIFEPRTDFRFLVPVRTWHRPRRRLAGFFAGGPPDRRAGWCSDCERSGSCRRGAGGACTDHAATRSFGKAFGRFHSGRRCRGYARRVGCVGKTRR